MSETIGKGTEHRATIIVLSGLGGVGKTAAALRWAHRHLERFTDGQLYVDLTEYRRTGGVDLSEALGSFLRVLGVREEYLPASFPERAAMFRSRTMSRKLLVVVENADQAAQVRPLIPSSSTSVVLVTSRRRLRGLITEGAEFIDVTPLTASESKLLMAEMLPWVHSADQEAVDDLATLCGGLPLALCVAGAQLSQRKNWSIPRLVSYLTDDNQRLDRLSFDGEDGVALMFDAAYSDLPGNAKRMYRLLGLHPGTQFALETAAAAAAVSPSVADELLGILLASNLVEELGNDRYRVHDLVHLHARARAEHDETRDERDGTIRRMIEWYARAATVADHVVMGEGRWRVTTYTPRPTDPTFDRRSAMKWFSAEQANLMAIVQESWQQELFTTVWSFCESLWAFYHNLKIYSDWLETHRLGVAAASRCGNGQAEAWIRNQLARAWIELGDFESAEEQLSKALGVASADRRAEAVVLESRGLLFRELGRYQEAEVNLRRACQLNEQLGSNRGVVIQTYQLGDVLVRAGRVEDGLRTLTLAMTFAERIHDEMSVAKVGIAMGRAYERMDRWDEARSVLRTAVKTTRDHGQPVREAQALEILVNVAKHDNDHDLLHRSAVRLMQLYEDAGSPQSAAVQALLDDNC